MKLFKTLSLFLVFVISLFSNPVSAQSCTSGIVYGINNSAEPGAGSRKGLYTINTTTGAGSLVFADLFGSGAPASLPSNADKTIRAIALDNVKNVIWYSNSSTAGSAARIFSYNINTNTVSSVSATFQATTPPTGLTKAAYNPVDKKIYFHDGDANVIYRFDPANPTAQAVPIGSLSVGNLTDAGNFSNGDIAFDGVGNLTGVFMSAGMLAVFPGVYDAAGNYTGLNLVGQKFATQTAFARSVAFLTNGNYLVGDENGSFIVNSNTGASTGLPTQFLTTDFASCAAPSPNLVVNKTAVLNCPAKTITYTITVQNTGQFHAVNTRLIDALSTGVTLTSATVNGASVAITGLGTTGILVKSPGAVTDGQVLKNETATIVLNCSLAANTVGQISNQAFVKYNGIESQNLPNNRIPSNDPATPAPNDPTIVTGCILISGTIFNDPNGMTGGVNGTPKQGVTVNLYAANGTTILATTTTDANGNYNFLGPVSGTYVVGVTPPTGFQNVSSTDATPTDGKTTITINNANVTGVNFGIEEPPTAYPISQSVTGQPSPVTLGPLQGSDPTDQPNQGSWETNTVTITTLPTNGFVLTYNGATVSTGQVIPNYDPTKLVIAPGPTTPGGTKTTTFYYTVTDHAGIASTPAPDIVNWSVALPVVFGNITGMLTGNTLSIKWEAVVERNNDHYEIEASTDGENFTKLGEVASKSVDGNSDGPVEYEFSKSISANGTLLGISIIFLGALLLTTRKKKWLVGAIVLICTIMVSYSCSKNQSDAIGNSTKHIFIRILQVDRDGKKSYSKVIEVVKD